MESIAREGGRVVWPGEYYINENEMAEVGMRLGQRYQGIKSIEAGGGVNKL